MSTRSYALAIAAVLFALDRLTKIAIERTVALYDSFHVIPGFFDIVHTKNPGAAFGMFADSDHPLRTSLLVGVSFAVLVFVMWTLLKPDREGHRTSPVTLLGLALILGGALGNMYDRVVYGMVTDFLEFYLGQYRFAAFNVADSGITVGAALLIIDMWRSRNQANVSQAH